MKKEDAISYLKQLYPNGGHCWLDEQRIEAIGMAIKALQEEPVSEDFLQIRHRDTLDEFAYQCAYDLSNDWAKETPTWHDVEMACKLGANWQKEQMMNGAVLCGVDGWFINNKRNCRKNGRFHKYYESTITHDKKLPMENGKDYRLIVIKEE